MELKGEQRIEASREKVWAALNDPEVLKACIPGCESFTQTGDNGFDTVFLVKVGPVKARFTGKVQLSDIRPPESYTISGEGKGGAAGMARGAAEVVLEEDGDGTILRYTMKADVGGKLAQIGSRLVSSTANKYAREFFTRFGDAVTGVTPPETAEATPETAPAAASPVAVTPPKGVPGPADPNAVHIRRLNWALLAINACLVTYILIVLA